MLLLFAMFVSSLYCQPLKKTGLCPIETAVLPGMHYLLSAFDLC